MREGLKTEGKDRALVDLACDRNCSAMGLHDFFDDGQPKSGATGILRPCLIGPIKLLKEMWEVLRLDPIARILDSHTNLLPGCLQAYGHSSTRRRVVKRVVEEINQCLVEPLCAPNDWWDRLGFKRQGDSAVIGKQGQFKGGLPLVNVARVKRERVRAMSRPTCSRLLRMASRYSSVVLAFRSATYKLPCNMVKGVFISWAAMSQKPPLNFTVP